MDWIIFRKLSGDYTVVNWDQRGFGHNYPDYTETEPITAETYMQDGLEMTDFLRSYLNKDKITVMGISWGSLFASNLALEHPDRYDAVIAMSLVVDIPESQQYFREVMLNETADDPEMHALAEQLDPEKLTFSPEEEENIKRLSERYCLYDDYFNTPDVSLLSGVWFNPYCTLKQQLEALGFSEDYNSLRMVQQGGDGLNDLVDLVQSLSLKDRTEYEIPFYLIEGKYDHGYLNMCEEAAAYFDKVQAPDKEMIYTEGGHSSPMMKSEDLAAFLHKIAEKPCQ